MKKPPKNIPFSSGVYFFKKGGKIVYIGKAKNLKERIASYFSKQNIDPRKLDMVAEAATMSWQKTDSDAEALIREAELIKKYKPKYNVVMRDDKQYFYVGFSNDEFPRIFLTHQPEPKIYDVRFKIYEYIGPFTDGTSLKQTLKMLRRAFPYCTCKGMHKRRCQNALIGRCLEICCLDLHKLQITNTKSQTNSKFKILNSKECKKRIIQYKKNLRIIKNILSGKGKALIQNCEKEMTRLSKQQHYEKAAVVRDQLYAVQNIFSHRNAIRREEENYAHKGLSYLTQLLKISSTPKRIEAYDISNIQGEYATGSMIVFTDGKPNTNEYRKFTIRLPHTPNDVRMMKEIITRRLNNNWPLPDVMVIDGGKAQRNAAENALNNSRITNKFKILHSNIVIIALAKKEEELYLPNEQRIKLKEGPPALLHLLQYIRDEAHRFAIQHHRKRRSALLKTVRQ